MPKNQYAKKLNAVRFALREEERRALIRKTTDTLFKLSTGALHEAFGFGPERQERFRRAFERAVLEYGAWMDGADSDYADGKLDEAYRQAADRGGA